MMNTNSSDLNHDSSNVVGNYVKKENLEKEIIKEEQIINWKKIRFDEYNMNKIFVLYHI